MVLLFALAASASAATPTESQAALYQALTARHLEQSCAELATLSPTPAEDLVWLAENTTQPSWVAIRAAACVVEDHAEPAAPALTRWVTSKATLGLALTTVPALDTLPVSVARPILEAGLAGPLADELRPRIQRLQTPELRSLVPSVPPATPVPAPTP